MWLEVWVEQRGTWEEGEKKLWRNMSSLASPSLPFLLSEKLAVLELFDWMRWKFEMPGGARCMALHWKRLHADAMWVMSPCHQWWLCQQVLTAAGSAQPGAPALVTGTHWDPPKLERKLTAECEQVEMKQLWKFCRQHSLPGRGDGDIGPRSCVTKASLEAGLEKKHRVWGQKY